MYPWEFREIELGQKQWRPVKCCRSGPHQRNMPPTSIERLWVLTASPTCTFSPFLIRAALRPALPPPPTPPTLPRARLRPPSLVRGRLRPRSPVPGSAHPRWTAADGRGAGQAGWSRALDPEEDPPRSYGKVGPEFLEFPCVVPRALLLFSLRPSPPPRSLLLPPTAMEQPPAPKR